MVSTSLTAIALLGLSVLQGLTAAPSSYAKRGGGQCTPFSGNFGESSEWEGQDVTEDEYDSAENGLKFNLLPPDSYTRKYDENEKSYYNSKAGRGPTFVYNSEVQYGRISAKIKAPAVGGAVTALIFKSTEGDEIDFELLASPDNAQTNYFWGKRVKTGENGEIHKGSVSDTFYKYTIDWSPKAIRWYIDDEMIRETTLEEIIKKKGKAMYPTNPSQIQIGLWDSSDVAGTAHWAQGPIKWSNQEVSAYIKDVTVECPY
ncbi:concanavalin A-like lectin/glucanase domain-containing protein [Halteromyces radiatus]|uniref:concanavalin A-like lectin/glucanase domain-containing protein n=1 Tax=Halteromyces radiatus TaxID=101107 RepID=UPI00221FCDA0|nr:concanavalin A-like lectin/glucanase domain-containing protein [Halteromyces radiatus]KAI8097713.1 concanavalin A-like lectin/glucanase domain-containing protein [Halteromyces radiatus]